MAIISHVSIQIVGSWFLLKLLILSQICSFSHRTVWVTEKLLILWQKCSKNLFAEALVGTFLTKIYFIISIGTRNPFKSPNSSILSTSALKADVAQRQTIQDWYQNLLAAYIDATEIITIRYLPGYMCLGTQVGTYGVPGSYIAFYARYEAAWVGTYWGTCRATA